MSLPHKLRCMSFGCDWKGLDTSALKSPHPFAPDRPNILGCPSCKSVGTIQRVCDNDGCWVLPVTGTRQKDLWLVWCKEHSR